MLKLKPGPRTLQCGMQGSVKTAGPGKLRRKGTGHGAANELPFFGILNWQMLQDELQQVVLLAVV